MVRITNVTAEDQGSYRCERIINGFEHNVADGFLDVLSKKIASWGLKNCFLFPKKFCF